MEISQDELGKIKKLAIRGYIKTVLLRFYANQMDGKGFDFFFVLSEDLDDFAPTK